MIQDAAALDSGSLAYSTKPMIALRLSSCLYAFLYFLYINYD